MIETEKLENQLKDDNEIIIEIIDGKTLLNKLLENSNYTISKLGSELGISNYAYEIFNYKSSKTPSRDHLIAILFLLKAELTYFNRTLQAFGYSKIYVKNPRDLVIYKAIINSNDFNELNANLINEGFEGIIR